MQQRRNYMLAPFLAIMSNSQPVTSMYIYTQWEIYPYVYVLSDGWHGGITDYSKSTNICLKHLNSMFLIEEIYKKLNEQTYKGTDNSKLISFSTS